MNRSQSTRIAIIADPLAADQAVSGSGIEASGATETVNIPVFGIVPNRAVRARRSKSAIREQVLVATHFILIVENNVVKRRRV